MAVFTNQATMTYNGITTTSNVAYGELLEVLAVSKTVVESSYATDGTVTYVVTLRNTGTVALAGLTVTDNLGGYPFGSTTVYPLTYITGTVRLFIDGTLQTAPTVSGEAPLVMSGITVPAGGDTVIVYQARVTAFADPAAEGTIVNVVTVTGTAISNAVSATATVGATAAPTLTITKTITPTQVTDNDRVTYTFVIQNLGNTAVTAADSAIITDAFDPILSALAVTFDGTAWTEGVQYSYSETTGLFTTVAGQLAVPAATYTQDATTGAYTTIPGTATLTVTGTI